MRLATAACRLVDLMPADNARNMAHNVI